MKIVVDTNVWVSGLLTPHGLAAQVVRGCLAQDWVLCVDARILSEYREVLKRPKFGFDHDRVDEILDHLFHIAEHINARMLLKRLPDPDDEPFLEVAVAAAAQFLITGNTKHFPARLHGVRTVSPAEFVNAFNR